MPTVKATPAEIEDLVRRFAPAVPMPGRAVRTEGEGEPLPPLREAAFQRQVIDLLHVHGWRVAHFRGVRVQRKNGGVYHQTPVQGDGSGFPDVIAVRGGRIIVAELKCGRNRLTQEQKVWLDCFRLAGVPAYEWRPELWAEIEKVLT
jgi:hypothetical protein